MTYRLRHTAVLCSFQCSYHQPVFEKKAAYLPKMASLLQYLTEDSNLLGLFDDNKGLTTKCVMIKGSRNVEENEPLSQIGVDMTNTKNNTIVEGVTKYSRRLICLTNQLEILHRAASKVFSGCLSSTPIQLLLVETQLFQLNITLKHQALSCFGRALRLLPESQRPWLKIIDQPVKEKILMVIILLI